MKAVIQHVQNCTITVQDKVISNIVKGFLCYIGIKKDDNSKDIDYLVDKILNLRIIEDENDKMNLSILDTKEQVMLVSQFTLYGDCRKGRRPGFDMAMKPEEASVFFDNFVTKFKDKYENVQTGQFQSYMLVSYTNMGPKTFIIDTSDKS